MNLEEAKKEIRDRKKMLRKIAKNFHRDERWIALMARSEAQGVPTEVIDSAFAGAKSYFEAGSSFSGAMDSYLIHVYYKMIGDYERDLETRCWIRRPGR